MKIKAIIHEAEEGETLEELQKNIREAIEIAVQKAHKPIAATTKIAENPKPSQNPDEKRNPKPKLSPCQNAKNALNKSLCIS